MLLRAADSRNLHLSMLSLVISSSYNMTSRFRRTSMPRASSQFPATRGPRTFAECRVAHENYLTECSRKSSKHHAAESGAHSPRVVPVHAAAHVWHHQHRGARLLRGLQDCRELLPQQPRGRQRHVDGGVPHLGVGVGHRDGDNGPQADGLAQEAVAVVRAGSEDLHVRAEDGALLWHVRLPRDAARAERGHRVDGRLHAGRLGPLLGDGEGPEQRGARADRLLQRVPATFQETSTNAVSRARVDDSHVQPGTGAFHSNLDRVLPLVSPPYG
mmetsp:Transcript_121982/g.331235  ORF Transcript_121982/g.331235 Transcript_121982/m.331235 type:complete len:272 (-) Transcript_121982:464-1279(-)